MKMICVILCMFFCLTAPVSAQEDLTVFTRWRQYSDVENALYNNIAHEAYQFLEKRESTIAGLDTRDEWQKYIVSVRKKLQTAFGPLPEKTPLNARITGTFEHEGITVENILYESRPGFEVTASLFKRTGLEGKLPTILYVCGHTSDGYKSYQHIILNLASKGFAVFAIDPIGQGERLQYYDPDEGKSLIGGPTSEHSYAGLQYLFTGRTMAMVRLWDCIRAVDYLCGRPDIDASRIGVHGRSGGGTMSSFLGAMDDRIAAAAPECYITGFRRLFQSIGPQDAEQNLLSQISSGLDHGDFLLARCPKPTLVVATTRDFFSVQGVRETVQSVRPAFRAFNLENNIGLIEDDAPHQSTKKNREGVYAFFANTFGVVSTPNDEDIPMIDPARLQVSSTGQVITSGSKTIYDLIREDSAVILQNLNNSRRNLSAHKERVERASRMLSGIKDTEPAYEAIFTGRIQKEGYTIEKVILHEENGIPIPALVFIPDGSGKYPAVLYLADKGKDADAADGGTIEAVVNSGYIVLAPDIPGCGELAVDVHQDDSVIKGVSYNLVFGAQLIGGSVTGIQAESILLTLRYLISRSDVAAGGITAVSRGITGPALLHAAVCDNTIQAVALLESPVSWESVINHRFYDQAIGSTIVPSALLYYDLPDLAGLLSPRKVLFVDPVDGNGEPAKEETRQNLTDSVNPYFRDNINSITITVTDRSNSLIDILSHWLGK